jgi:hypothetical protein
LTRAESQALARQRRGRNLALLVALGMVAILLYAVSMVKLGATIGAQLGGHS